MYCAIRFGRQIMVTPVYSDVSDKNYSVVVSFERHPFVLHRIAYFDSLDTAYDWLKDVDCLLLCEHILQIYDKDCQVLFHLSYFLEFDELLNKEKFVTEEHWFNIPDCYKQADLPF